MGPGHTGGLRLPSSPEHLAVLPEEWAEEVLTEMTVQDPDMMGK